MKKKALMAVLLCVMGLGAIAIGNVEAAATFPGWNTCLIKQAGADNSGNYYVMLADASASPSFGDTIFIIDNSSGNAKDMYAAALTAWANGTNVSAYLVNTVSHCYGIIATK
jgi:hypothetical protein